MSNSIPPHEAPEFTEFLQQLVHGEVNQKLTEDLGLVVDAVNETGLQGELKIVFKFKKESGRAIVTVDVARKIPEHPIHGTLFHFGNGSLLREDPKQMKFKDLEKQKIRIVEDE